MCGREIFIETSRASRVITAKSDAPPLRASERMHHTTDLQSPGRRPL